MKKRARKVSRPPSITTICIINWILSAFYILIGVAVLAVMIYAPELVTQALISFEPMQTDLITLIIGMLAWLFLLSIFTIVAFYYVWKMKARGWNLGIIALLVLIFTNLPLSLSLFLPIEIVYVIMLFVLWRNRYIFVK